MLEEREQIVKENANFFYHPKKVKDKYDLEYDRGKQKKVKKKKPERKVKNDFQKAALFLYKKNKLAENK